MKTLLIKNASHILTMDDKENELTNSSIFCRSGVIEWVGDYKNLKEKADHTIDAKDLIVIQLELAVFG